MSSTEKHAKVRHKERYDAPEIVRLGAALELTAGNPDEILSDGSPKPNGYKDVEIRSSVPPGKPTQK